MVDYDSRQLTWVKSRDGTHWDTLATVTLGVESLPFFGGTWHTDSTYLWKGPAGVASQRHYMIESVSLYYYDSAGAGPDITVSFWSSSTGATIDANTDTYCGHLDFADATVTAFTTNYSRWDDHDVRIPYTITSDEDDGSDPYLHVGLYSDSAGGIVAGDKTSILVGLRPLRNS